MHGIAKGAKRACISDIEEAPDRRAHCRSGHVKRVAVVGPGIVNAETACAWVKARHERSMDGKCLRHMPKELVSSTSVCLFALETERAG